MGRREKLGRLAWQVEEGNAVITLGAKRLGFAYAPKENPKEVHEKMDEICLRYNTWTQIWLALKAAQRGDKYWLTEVEAAIKAAGRE